MVCVLSAVIRVVSLYSLTPVFFFCQVLVFEGLKGCSRDRGFDQNKVRELETGLGI